MRPGLTDTPDATAWRTGRAGPRLTGREIPGPGGGQWPAEGYDGAVRSNGAPLIPLETLMTASSNRPPDNEPPLPDPADAPLHVHLAAPARWSLGRADLQTADNRTPSVPDNPPDTSL